MQEVQAEKLHHSLAGSSRAGLAECYEIHSALLHHPGTPGGSAGAPRVDLQGAIRSPAGGGARARITPLAASTALPVRFSCSYFRGFKLFLVGSRPGDTVSVSWAREVVGPEPKDGYSTGKETVCGSRVQACWFSTVDFGGLFEESLERTGYKEEWTDQEKGEGESLRALVSE